ATDKEKSWWFEGTHPTINGERLPLVLARDIPFKKFAKKSEIAKAGRFWDYDKGIVMIIELPFGDHEVAIGEFNRQIFDQLRNTAPQDIIRVGEQKGNPWLTIILEVASFETLEHVKDKINNFWLVPNRCEDVIVFKLGNWSNKHRDQNGQPLRRLCAPPLPPLQVLSQTSAPGVAIDLYEIQQAIFDAMGKN
ncbi:4010_t:CDS:2, partial [Racocetra persica]